jgi:hypothetical protein
MKLLLAILKDAVVNIFLWRAGKLHIYQAGISL